MWTCVKRAPSEEELTERTNVGDDDLIGWLKKRILSQLDEHAFITKMRGSEIVISVSGGIGSSVMTIAVTQGAR